MPFSAQTLGATDGSGGTKSAVRRAINGALVEWNSEVEMSTVFTSDIILSFEELDGRRQRLCAGPIKFGRDTAFDPDVSIGMVFTDQFEFQGGQLLLGEGVPTVGPDGAQYWESPGPNMQRIKLYRIAVWEGAQFSFYAHKYGGEKEDILRCLERLQIEEHEEGLAIKPRGDVSNSRQATVMQVIPNIGDFYSVRLTQDSARNLPRHSGTKVRGGELYAHESENGKVAHMTLVNESSITRMTPDEGTPEEDLMACMTELVVNWR